VPVSGEQQTQHRRPRRGHTDLLQSLLDTALRAIRAGRDRLPGCFQIGCRHPPVHHQTNLATRTAQPRHRRAFGPAAATQPRPVRCTCCRFASIETTPGMGVVGILPAAATVSDRSRSTKCTGDLLGISLRSRWRWQRGAMTTSPSLARSASGSGERRYRLGDPLGDRCLEMVAGRARPNRGVRTHHLASGFVGL
jgi:hypothetical protein